MRPPIVAAIQSLYVLTNATGLVVNFDSKFISLTARSQKNEQLTLTTTRSSSDYREGNMQYSRAATAAKLNKYNAKSPRERV